VPNGQHAIGQGKPPNGLEEPPGARPLDGPPGLPHWPGLELMGACSSPVLSGTLGRPLARQLRVKRGLSQERLAFDAGVDRSYVGGLESGLPWTEELAASISCPQHFQ
jgi:hypothetical protein